MSANSNTNAAWLVPSPATAIGSAATSATIIMPGTRRAGGAGNVECGERGGAARDEAR